MTKDFITLAHGSGGEEMDELIKSFNFSKRGDWKECDNDSSVLDLATLKKEKGEKLVFTSDSFVVDPIFFPGGNIGHLAFCGTVNDLVVMGAKPLGLSLSIIIEEGFPKKDLGEIVASIKELSEKYNVPIVTGDTKVMSKGKVDKIIINTSGVGLAPSVLTTKIEPGDKIIISGGLGEHAVALLSKRFDYETDILTDSKPLIEEIESIKDLIKIAKDPTRGGISAVLNEIGEKNNISMLLDEESIPAKDGVKSVVGMLGIDIYGLACEGRFVCVCKEENSNKVVEKLKQFNSDASIIGEIIESKKDELFDDKKDHLVFIQTLLGKRVLPKPTGRIVPRIC